MAKKAKTLNKWPQILPVATSEKYEVIGLDGVAYTAADFHQYGFVDFTNLSEAKAEHLISLGFPFLKLKEKTDE